MDLYSTHLPILEQIINNFDIKTVVETGMGFFSTKLFIDNCDKIISIEMQSDEWFDKICFEYKDSKNFLPLKMIGTIGACEYLSSIKDRYDLIFIDGHGDNRWQQINSSFDISDLIVVHDTESEAYRWNLVRLPKEWKWYDIENFHPKTSVITKRQDIISNVCSNFKATERNFSVIPIFIISFNRVSCMEESMCSYVNNIGTPIEIIIYDNGSDYSPCLSYLEKKEQSGCFVYYNKKRIYNMSELCDDIYTNVINPYLEKNKNIKYYIVTDNDIRIEKSDGKCLDVYRYLLEHNSDINVVGPDLITDDISDKFLQKKIVIENYNHIKIKDINFSYENKTINAIESYIDTTFGMYRSNFVFKNLNKSIRVGYPYNAKHLYWYINFDLLKEDEFNYIFSGNSLSGLCDFLKKERYMDVKTNNTKTCFVIQNYNGNIENSFNNVFLPIYKYTLSDIITHPIEYKSITYYNKDRTKNIIDVDYKYENNHIKFVNLIKKIYNEFLEYEQYVFIEHDCFVSNANKIENVSHSCHNLFPSVWGTMWEGNNWFVNYPYAKHKDYIGGCFYIINKKCIEELYAFFIDNNDIIDSWKGSCDLLLHSFCEEKNVPVVMLNYLSKCAWPGKRFIVDFFSKEISIYHKIDEYYSEIFSKYYKDIGNYNGDISHIDRDCYLSDLKFDSISEYESCGRNGYMYSEDRCKIEPFFRNINTEKSIGIHASSVLVFKFFSEIYVKFSTSFFINSTSDKKIIYSIQTNIDKESENVVVSGAEDTPYMVCRYFPPGNNTIIIQTIPVEEKNHYAHSCLLNPSFSVISKNDYRLRFKNMSFLV